MDRFTKVERFETKEDWARSRYGKDSGIGASEAAAVIGQCPFENATEIWLKKTGRANGKSATIAMRAGTVLEPLILELYAEKTGRVVEHWDQNARLRSKEYDWMTCTPDGIVLDDGLNPSRLVQCKSVEIRNREQAGQWGEDGSDEIPFAYLIQVHHEMVVTGHEVSDIPVLFGKSDFKVYTVEFNADLGAKVVGLTGIFWRDCVLADVPPEDHFVTAAQLLKIYPGCEGAIELGTQVEYAVRSLERIRESCKSEDKEKDRLNALVLAALGTAQFGRLPDGRLVKRIVTRVPARTQTVKAYEHQRFIVVKGA